MDAQDHKKNALSEQEIHSVQLCHKCGWPFPNPHPSAKHRRAHKRVCGTIEGYKLLDSGSDHSNCAGSDNEHVSDDDRRNPSPKRSIKESAYSSGMGLKSNQSEDELFSDAIPEFSNNGANPSLDKNVGEGVEVFHVLKDEKTAGTSQPPHGLTELLQGSIKAGEMSDYAVMRGEMNQSEITNSISDIGNEKVLDVVSSRPCLESNSSLAISELIVVSESFHDTSELIVVGDNNKTDLAIGKCSSSLGPCIKDDEKGDETNEDVHCTTTSEVLQSDRKLEIEPTSGPLELEATTTKVEKETLDPQVQSDSQFKLNNVNVETSHARIVDETANQEEVLEDDLQFKYDASSRTKHQELRDALSVSEVESDSPKESIHCSPGLSSEVRDMEEVGNESTPFLSPAETFPAEENSGFMIGDFKDHEMLKSGVSLDLRAGEEERSSENDQKIPILEIFQDALSKLPDGSVDWSSSSPSESKVDKQHVSMPESGTFFISTKQHLPSTTANVFAGNIDEFKEKSVSTTVDGEVGTAVPDLPSAQSSVHAENEAYTSEKVPNLQNSQNAASNVSAGTVDNSSSDTFNGDLDKAGVSTSIDREIGMAVPENLSSVPYGTEGNSSSDSLQDDLKKVGTSTFIGGVTSVTANILCPSSSMSAGTSDEFLSDALKDDLKKEGVSTSVSVEFIPPVLPVATEDSGPAGTLEHITSEAMHDDLKKNSVSTPINGDANTSLRGNLPITNSSVLVGAVDNSASEPVADELRKEVVSEPDDGEAGASAHEDLIGTLSNIPVIGSSDDILSEALEDDHEEEGFSTLHDRDVGTSNPDNLPCVLSSVPAGTTDNSSKDALTKEGVLTHDFVEDGSSEFRETSGEDNQLLPLALTLPSVKNPEAMIGDFEDHKVLKSSFTFDVRTDEEIKLAEDDKKVFSENPIALKNVPDGYIDNLEDDFKTEGVSIPIHGEVGAFGFMGTSDEESHLLSVADTSPTVDNPEALIEEFKDYKVLKSSFSMELGAAEETISLENDKKVTSPENLPSAVSYGVPSESIDSSPSDALEDDLIKDGVPIPIDGEIDASEFKFIKDVNFGSSSLGNYLKAPNCETNNSEPNNNAERSLTRSIDGKSMQNEDLEPILRQEADDEVPLESSTGELNLQMVKLCGGGNANNHGDDKLAHVIPGNENAQPGNEPSASDSTTLARVETMPETILLVGNHSLGLENSSTGFSSIADIGIVEVTKEERLANQSHPTCESLQQLVISDCLDDARNSDHMNVETGASGEFCNSSDSSRHIDEILHNSEGLKVGEETKVSNLSSAPGIVSELKYEDPIQRSEKTPKGSNLKEVADLATESQKIRDPATQDNVDENITKPNRSILAVDNSTVSSSRADSLEGNWGSVSVLSTQSDVGNVADAEVLSSTDTQDAEKLFKKPEKGKETAMESHPDKSDVFEPPSFMTLVESKSEADEKAGWFPSITNVVNESEGRKKNEEIISKVTNWNTAGKQHSPLKNLLNEAHAETKVKSLSPNAKQLVPAVNNQADETASASKNTGIPQTATTTTVSSILGSEMPSNADTVKKEIEKEWNSPARYPIQMKKEKRKGKPYWVPFVCCASVQQDV